ncbi:hypothetical protein [uncultured Imperialibacter sp.]|uniref:hypothetical protein n=1 Tax=uncultured Imperialibacter sp. TaxID=1672639 RepID=UPI0030D9CFAB|tara:strand:- start:283 stop:723 length:441 start_codon:yes stop_codon:yes gene_type:complete
MTEKIRLTTILKLTVVGAFFLLAARPTFWLINSDQLTFLDRQPSQDTLPSLLMQYFYIKVLIVLMMVVLSLIQNRKANQSYLNSLIVGILIMLLARFDLFHISEMILRELAFGDFEISLVVVIVLANSMGFLVYRLTLKSSDRLVK